MKPYWRVELLGGLRLIHDSVVTSRFERRKTAALLAFLAYEPGKYWPRFELAERFWPEKIETASLASLRNELSVLRHYLEPAPVKHGAVLDSRGGLVRMREEQVATDVTDFKEALLRAEEAPDPALRAQLLERAVSQCKGPLLSGFYEDWIPAEQIRLAESCERAFLDLTNAHESLGNLEKALHFARVGSDSYPENEEIRRREMELLASSGHAIAALKRYEELESWLRRERHSAPAAATHRLALRIREMAPPTRSDTDSPRPAGSRQPHPQRSASHPPSQPVSQTASSKSGVRASLGELTAGALRTSTENFTTRSSTIFGVDAPTAQHPAEIRPSTVLSLELSNRAAFSSSTEAEQKLAARSVADILIRYQAALLDSPGDRIVAVFGAWQVHEDDPERAVLAAIEIRDALGRAGLQVSCGLSTGELVGTGGSPAEPARGAVPVISMVEGAAECGGVIRQADYAQSCAEVGEICVTGSTHRYIHHAFDSRPAVPAAYPLPSGTPQQEALYLVTGRRLGVSKTRGVAGLPSVMVGREAELARLRKSYTEASRGRGQIACISGDPGTGKSRLIGELKRTVLQQAKARGGPAPLWVEGRGLEARMVTGYSLWIDIVRQCLAALAGRTGESGHRADGPTSAKGTPPRESPGSDAAEIRGALLVLENRLEMEDGTLAAHASVLADLLSLPLEPVDRRMLAALDPDQMRRMTFNAVRELISALSKWRPAVLVFDDLHWTDRPTLDLMAYMAEELEDHQILIVCAYRPGAEHPCHRWGLSASRVHTTRFTAVQLGDLSPAEGELLIRSLLQMTELPSSFTGRVLGLSHGNPFYIEELIRSFIANGVLQRSGEQWELRDDPDAPMAPEGILCVILARTDRLPADQRLLLQLAAVAGQVFRRRVLDQLAPARMDVERLIEELEERSLIYRERVLPEEEYSFNHLLTRSAVYRSLAPARRAEIHQQVAEAITTLAGSENDAVIEELAHHYSHTHSTEKAAEYLLKAAQKAARRYANEEAASYLKRALERINAAGRPGAAAALSTEEADSPQPISQKMLEYQFLAHELLGDILFTQGEHNAASMQFECALQMAPANDHAHRAVLQGKRADSLHWQGRMDLAIEIVLSSLAEWPGQRWAPEAVRLLEVAMRSYWATGKLEAAQRCAAELGNLLSRTPYSTGIYRIYYGIAWLEIKAKRFAPAEAWLARMEAVCMQHEDRNGLARCYHGYGDLYRKQELYGLAIPWLKRSLEYCSQTGDIHYLMEGHLEMAQALILTGEDPGGVEAHIDAGLRFAAEMLRSAPVQEVFIYCELLAEAALRKDRVEWAALVWRKAVEMGAESSLFINALGQRCRKAGCEEAFRRLTQRRLDTRASQLPVGFSVLAGGAIG